MLLDSTGVVRVCSYTRPNHDVEAGTLHIHYTQYPLVMSGHLSGKDTNHVPLLAATPFYYILGARSTYNLGKHELGHPDLSLNDVFPATIV